MRELMLQNYMPKQIKLEEEYYDKLQKKYWGLIAALSQLFIDGADKQTIYQVGIHDKAQYEMQAEVNPYMVRKVSELVYSDILKQPDVLPIPSMMASIVDYHINTTNLTNTIIGIFLTAVPVGQTLIQTKYRKDIVDELVTRCFNAIKRTVQNTISQDVSNGLMFAAKQIGYTEYLPDNQHDEKVREVHREENNGKTWYKIDNPPSSGYTGTEYGCRCIVIGFR